MLRFRKLEGVDPKRAPFLVEYENLIASPKGVIEFSDGRGLANRAPERRALVASSGSQVEFSFALDLTEQDYRVYFQQKNIALAVAFRILSLDHRV